MTAYLEERANLSDLIIGSKMPKVTVVIPVFDETRGLAVLVGDLRAALGRGGFECEVVIVDDGSTNGCPWAVGVATAGVRVLHQAQRRGSGYARRIGSREAQGDWIAWIDGDGTYAAEDLVRLIEATEDADQVIGSRTEDHGRWRRLRLAVKGTTCRVASWLWRTRIPDLNSGLRVFRRKSLMTYLHEVPNGFSCVTTATLAALNRKQKVVFLPVNYHPRAVGSRSKFHPVWDTLRLWRVVYRQWRARGRLERGSHHG